MFNPVEVSNDFFVGVGVCFGRLTLRTQPCFTDQLRSSYFTCCVWGP